MIFLMKIFKSVALLTFFVLNLMILSNHCWAGDSVPIAFEIWPYMTNVGKNEATINFRLKSEGKSFIKYGITLDFEQKKVVLKTVGSQHSIILKDLKPDTVYFYNINNIYNGTFRTDNLSNKLRFVAFGHSHGTERFDQYPDRLLLAKVADLDPDFIVHMGDATYYSTVDSFKEYFFDEFKSLIGKIPIYISPGNHDAGWPFVYGLDLTNFKKLFDYPYPKEILDNKKEAFYSITKGNIQFLFISYTSPLDQGSLQRKWLESKLNVSPYDFNIIIYGGAQFGYSDEKSFLDFISKFKVDLILNGDGSQQANKFLKKHNGIPIYFVGTNGAAPHSLLYFEHEEDHLSIKQVDALGKIISTDWIYTKHKYKTVIPLTIDARNFKTTEEKTTIAYNFKEPLSSRKISGLQILLKSPRGEKAIIYAYITPEDISTGRRNNEGGFRTQYHEFSGESDSLVTLSFPKTNPFKGGDFKITKLRVEIVPLKGKFEDFELQEMYLY